MIQDMSRDRIHDSRKIQMQNSEEKRIKEFTDLISWQKSHELVLMIYKATEKFPKSEVFGFLQGLITKTKTFIS